MKRTHNKAVAEMWSLGKEARSSSMSTDGKRIYSYHLPIGNTEKGDKVVISYVARTGFHISTSTSQHVSFALKFADKEREPTEEEWEHACNHKR